MGDHKGRSPEALSVTIGRLEAADTRTEERNKLDKLERDQEVELLQRQIFSDIRGESSKIADKSVINTPIRFSGLYRIDHAANEPMDQTLLSEELGCADLCDTLLLNHMTSRDFLEEVGIDLSELRGKENEEGLVFVLFVVFRDCGWRTNECRSSPTRYTREVVEE